MWGLNLGIKATTTREYKGKREQERERQKLAYYDVLSCPLFSSLER
jgi:hypothetical protein